MTFSKMLDAQWCKCGGQYDHINQEQDDDGVIDSYFCDQCETFYYIVWDPETGEEKERYCEFED